MQGIFELELINWLYNIKREQLENYNVIRDKMLLLEHEKE